MRVLVLLGLCLLLLCCGCNTLYRFWLFRQVFGDDEDEVRTVPFKGAWEVLAHMPAQRAAACARIGTKIYVCGGENTTGALDAVESYDIGTDTWTTLNSLPAPTSAHVCVALDDKLYVFGGTASVAWVYDPAGDSWSPVAPPERTLYASAAALDGKVYYFGGTLSSGYTVATTQIYNAGLDSWSPGELMPESRAGSFCSELGGRIYIIGGYHNPPGGPMDSYEATVFEYDPVSTTWALRAPMTHPRAYGTCGAASGAVLVIGGYDGSYPGLEYVEMYDPLDDSWRSLNVEPSLRSFTCGASMGNVVYIFGGKIGETTYAALGRKFISP